MLLCHSAAAAKVLQYANTNPSVLVQDQKTAAQLKRQEQMKLQHAHPKLESQAPKTVKGTESARSPLTEPGDDITQDVGMSGGHMKDQATKLGVDGL